MFVATAKELVHAGLISSRQEGGFIYYSPVLTFMNDLVAFLTESARAWQGQDDAREGIQNGCRRNVTTNETLTMKQSDSKTSIEETVATEEAVPIEVDGSSG